ncbi:uncharacterized protein AB675_9517 [Cyphellophora attinorum]|uniref:Protein NRDE2-like protein n=1 Tax=Cyphellophora attinorum TaxID=1664694 RepID=A0A0N1P008_9EURO|nr:uncharacterized protein AB675_9517 [Phialophora attinorum]KPI42467.1 hypothetical protein AB675_9517 [Phialophora attinorum]
MASGPAWKSDLRGDVNNLQYGSLEKSKIPKYRLSGHGRVIGLDRSFRISTHSQEHREVITGSFDLPSRRKDQSLATARLGPEQQITSAQESLHDPVEEQSSYVAFDHPRKRVKLSPGHDPRFSKASASTRIQLDEVHIRQRKLTNQVTDDPEDVKSWLDLIDHQALVVRGSDRADLKLTRSQRQTLISMRIALYEQALAKVTQATARQTLVAGLMKEGSQIWDHERQVSEWERVLKTGPSFELRLLYLNFLMSASRSFSCEHVLEVMSGYFGLYRRESASRVRDRQLIHLLSRLTMFLSQAGFRERAFAIWQANLELAYYKDESLIDPITEFEHFWDSERPRIGEAGAKGWTRSTDSVARTEDLSAEAMSHSGQDQLNDYASWAASEAQVSNRQTLPARTSENSTDPYRVILFADIEPYLFCDFAPEEDDLLNAFLRFCELPLHDAIDGDSAIDTFLWNKSPFADGSAPSDTFGLAQYVTPDTNERMSTTAASPVPKDNLQHTPLVKTAVEVLQQILSSRTGDEDLADYILTFESFDSRLNPSKARKLAKKFLKQFPSSIRLYNTYADIEARSKGLRAAEQIWLTVLSMLGRASVGRIRERLSILRSWAWQCTLNDQSGRALQVLSNAHLTAPILDATQPTSDHQLQQAESFLWSELSRAHAKPALEELVLIVQLLALLQYHFKDRDLSTSLQVYEQCLALSTFLSAHLPATTKRALEQLHVHRNELISHHMRSPGTQFKPKQIIASLQDSCRAFPHNLVFRKQYNIFVQNHGGIDRLRATAMSLQSTSEMTLIDHLSNVHTALSLPSYQGGTEHVIRAAFQHAVLPPGEKNDDVSASRSTSTNIRSCPAINVAFLKWELSLLRALPSHETTVSRRTSQPSAKRDQKVRNRQVQNVRKAFRVAVGNCPWVKEIYLLYFDEALRDEISVSEWEEVYESMLERGLRICVER